MKNRSTLAVGFLLIGCAMAGVASHAAPLTSDSFSYTGPLTSNGWFAYSGGDTSVLSDGNKAIVGTGREDIRLPFTDQGTGPTYASFALNITSIPATGSEYTFGFVDSSTMESRFGIVAVGGSAFRLTGWGAQGTAALATNITDLALNTDYTVTIYFDGVNDHRLWIDAGPGDFAAPAIQVTASNAGIDGFFIRQAGSMQTNNINWSMDDLTIATTFEEVLGAPPAVATNVKFSSSSASVAEDVGTYQITVVKTLAEGDVSGEILLGGTATEGAGNDYTIDTTNFVLNGATTSATFTITVNDDAVEELSETITLGIVNVTGGTVVAPNQFTLTITDNDTTAPTGILISQYTETDVSTTPKGIEVWNNTGADITFDSTINKLEVKVGSNGGSPNSAVVVTNGTLLNGDVLVIGTSDMTPDVVQGFTFNGNDAIVLEFGGFVVDVVGTVGNNPGVAWTNAGVSTKDQNIQLKTGINTGDADGWLDPSERFEFVALGSVLTGFGVAPGGTPIIPTNVSFAVATNSASEDIGTIEVTVVKSLAEGDVSGQVILGGTATEGLAEDYTIDTTNFTMNGATTTATFTITINDDALVEGPQTVTLTLANVVGGIITAPSTFTLTIVDDDIPPPPTGGVVWINEFLYNPPGADSNEFVEIAGPAGTDLSVYQVYWYNGGNGAVYGSNVLSGVIDDEGCGLGAVEFAAVLQNGPDALALVSNGTTVIQFISYGGSFIATDGPAIGMTPTDIGVTANSTNDTVQLSGTGDTEAEFTWAVTTESRGSLNVNQTIEPCGGGATPSDYDISGLSLPGAVPTVAVPTESGFTYELQYTTNLLAAPQTWITIDSEPGNDGTVNLIDPDPTTTIRLYRISAE